MLCQWLCFVVMKMSGVVLCWGKRGGTRNVNDGILLLKLNLCYLLEFCADGVVLFMCGFFCRSECPIEVSRWVLCEVIHENYLLLLCVCVIVKVCFHYMFLVCFQSGGGGAAAVAAVVVAIHHLQFHWPWVMEVVSKTLFVCVCVVIVK